MTIQSIKWATAVRDSLAIKLENGSDAAAPWPVNRTHWRERIQAWLDAGGAIAAEDPPPTPPSNADLFDGTVARDPVFKAFLMAFNKGTVVPGADALAADLKAAILAEMPPPT